MSLKPFETLNKAYLVGQSKVYDAVEGIQKALQTLEVPEITPNSGQLKGITINENITYLGEGYLLIEVGELKELVSFGDLLLRPNNDDGVIEVSADSGETWLSIASGPDVGNMLMETYDSNADGTVDAADEAAQVSDGVNTVTPAELRTHLDSHPTEGDMYKATYDTDDDGRVDAADEASQVSDGVNTVTPEELRTHLDSHPTEGDMYKTDYDANDDGRVDAADEAAQVSDGVNTVTPEELRTHLDDPTIHGGDEWTYVTTNGGYGFPDGVGRIRLRANSSAGGSMVLPHLAASPNADIHIVANFTTESPGLMVYTQDGTLFYGGGTTRSFSANAVAGDYLHIVAMGTQWLVLDSRGSWG